MVSGCLTACVLIVNLFAALISLDICTNAGKHMEPKLQQGCAKFESISAYQPPPLQVTGYLFVGLNVCFWDFEIRFATSGKGRMRILSLRL